MTTLIQEIIIETLGVKPSINAKDTANKLVRFLAQYLRKSGLDTYVLGVSGGVDSTVAARLAQLAVQQNRMSGYDCKFIAVRLPYGVQRDEGDAQRALKFIDPDETKTINIRAASDAMLSEVSAQQDGQFFKDAAHEDFVLGNIKARQRMIAQYAIAGATKGCVIGTDHAAEAVMGFFTKFGDGAADICPLAGLTKGQVREIGAYLGAPSELVNKPPTADLENLNPGKLDEEAYGVSYDTINAYLRGEVIDAKDEEIIFNAYANTQHKRALPVTPAEFDDL
jgi:NAD+ synthase